MSRLLRELKQDAGLTQSLSPAQRDRRVAVIAIRHLLDNCRGEVVAHGEITPVLDLDKVGDVLGDLEREFIPS